MDKVRPEIEKAMNALSLPPGYRWSFGGGFNDDDEAGAQMGFNTLLALLMIFIVMAAVFESLLYPVAILTSIAFSYLGMYWLFAITGTTFSLMAGIGFLILMGVVVNNGIVMVEHINQVMSALAGCVWGHWAWSPAWIHFDAPLAAWRPTHGTTSSNDTATG